MKPTGRDHLVGVAYIVAAITAWGAYFPFAKLILLKLSPVVFLIFRLGIGAAVLVVLSKQFGKSFEPKRSDMLVVILAGVIGIVLHQLIQVTGLRYTTATNTGWILTTIPPVTGLLGWIFLRETVSLKQIAGLVIAMIGVVFFVAKGEPTKLSFTRNIGDALALASVVTWSTYTVLTKSRLSTYDPLPMSAVHMTLGFVCFLLIGGGAVPGEVTGLDGRDWVILTLIGIIPSGLAYFWWNAGLKRLSAVNTSTFLFIEAIVASLTGYLVLGEQFTLSMVLAGIIMIVGVSVTQLRE